MEKISWGIIGCGDVTDPKTAWRVDPAIAGGWIFHDLAPHQLDLLYHFFGAIESSTA